MRKLSAINFMVWFVACFVLMSAATAQTSCGGAALSYTAPTQNTDGTPLTNLAGYRVVYGTSAANLTQTIQIANPSVTSYCVTGLSPATYYFGVKAYNSEGTESDVSNVVSKVITNTPTPVRPAAPATLTVAAGALIVYQVLGTDGGFQFLPVGTVPPNTQCITTQQVNGRYAVPASAVTWYGSVKPKVVVAQCN
jgi:hypothetical protein